MLGLLTTNTNSCGTKNFNMYSKARYVMSSNSIVFTMLTSECYLWLILLYILNCFNIKEKESEVS